MVITESDWHRALPARYRSKVRTAGPNDCWVWTATTTTGYGRIKLDGKMVLAHRLSYEMLVGPIGPTMFLDHSCFNRACVNPNHLRPVSNKQNQEHRSGAQRNSRSGVRGVSWQPDCSKWRVNVAHDGRSRYGGLYATLEEAANAARNLRRALFTHDDGGDA